MPKMKYNSSFNLKAAFTLVTFFPLFSVSVLDLHTKFFPLSFGIVYDF